MNQYPNPDNLSQAAREALISLAHCKGILHKGGPHTFLLEEVKLTPAIPTFSGPSSPIKYPPSILGGSPIKYSYYASPVRPYNYDSGQMGNFSYKEEKFSSVESMRTVKKEQHFLDEFEEEERIRPQSKEKSAHGIIEEIDENEDEDMEKLRKHERDLMKKQMEINDELYSKAKQHLNGLIDAKASNESEFDRTTRKGQKSPKKDVIIQPSEEVKKIINEASFKDPKTIKTENNPKEDLMKIMNEKSSKKKEDEASSKKMEKEFNSKKEDNSPTKKIEDEKKCINSKKSNLKQSEQVEVEFSPTKQKIIENSDSPKLTKEAKSPEKKSDSSNVKPKKENSPEKDNKQNSNLVKTSETKKLDNSEFFKQKGAKPLKEVLPSEDIVNKMHKEQNSPEFKEIKQKSNAQSPSKLNDESTTIIDQTLNSTIKKLYENFAKKDQESSTFENQNKSDILADSSREKTYSFSKESPKKKIENVDESAEFNEENLLLDIYKISNSLQNKKTGNKPKKINKSVTPLKNRDQTKKKDDNFNKTQTIEVSIPKKKANKNSYHSTQKQAKGISVDDILKSNQKTIKKNNYSPEQKKYKDIHRAKTPENNSEIQVKTEMSQNENENISVEKFNKEFLRILAEKDRVWTQNRIKTISSHNEAKKEILIPKDIKQLLKKYKNLEKTQKSGKQKIEKIKNITPIRQRPQKVEIRRIGERLQSPEKPILNPMKLFNILNKYIHAKTCTLEGNE